MTTHLHSPTPAQTPARIKQKGQAKTAMIPIKPLPPLTTLKKPSWIRVKAGNEAGRFGEVKRLLREKSLHTVCEEAACPNIGECFGRGTATFMILGDICTRRCPFCDVAHGRPSAVDPDEPMHLAQSVATLQLAYVVITSVDRDDLRDGGAGHFAEVIKAVRAAAATTQIEVLTPDFRGRHEIAIEAFAAAPPDVLNHNLETVPRLYKAVRPGADYHHSLLFLQAFRQRYPHIPTKSGLMVGLGEREDEIYAVMRDLRAHGVDLITIGQYLAPSNHHLPVVAYIDPAVFKRYEEAALAMGFRGAACGPMVRSSYWADQLAHR